MLHGMNGESILLPSTEPAVPIEEYGRQLVESHDFEYEELRAIQEGCQGGTLEGFAAHWFIHHCIRNNKTCEPGGWCPPVLRGLLVGSAQNAVQQVANSGEGLGLSAEEWWGEEWEGFEYFQHREYRNRVATFYATQYRCSPSIHALRALCAFTQLQHLELADCQIAVLPEAFQNLQHLQTLKLPYNKFAQFPINPAQHPHVQRLELQGNLLSDLPDNVGQLANLYYLNLSNNRFFEVLPGVIALKNLQGLDVSNNVIRELPAGIDSLPVLERLDASDNCIENCACNFSPLPCLRTLILSHNKLKTLPESLAHCTQLKTLFIDNNYLGESVRPIIAVLRNIEIIDDHNPYTGEHNSPECLATAPPTLPPLLLKISKTW